MLHVLTKAVKTLYLKKIIITKNITIVYCEFTTKINLITKINFYYEIAASPLKKPKPSFCSQISKKHLAFQNNYFKTLILPSHSCHTFKPHI
jgi:hypothetical protein